MLWQTTKLTLEHKILLEIIENPSCDLFKYRNIVSHGWMMEMLSKYGVALDRNWKTNGKHIEQTLILLTKSLEHEASFNPFFSYIYDANERPRLAFDMR